jgi:hypothetical protein
MIVLRPPPGFGDAAFNGLVPQRFQGGLHPGKVLGSDQQVYVTPGADGTAGVNRLGQCRSVKDDARDDEILQGTQCRMQGLGERCMTDHCGIIDARTHLQHR